MENTKTNKSFSFFEMAISLYTAGLPRGIDPVDMRNTFLPIFFLASADKQHNSSHKPTLPEGYYGTELMQRLIDAPANNVCKMVDEALKAIENSNYTTIECKSHPLTNICFAELESKYDTDVFSEYVCEVAKIVSRENLTTFLMEDEDYAHHIFVDLVEDFSKRFPETAQYTTPHDIVDLMRNLVMARTWLENRLPIRKTFDPACGVGYALTHCGGSEVYGQEISPTTYTLANMAMLLSGRKAHIALGDSLNSPNFWSEISRGEFDVAVSTPPLNVSNWKKTTDYDAAYHWGVPSDHYGEWAFISQMLSSVNGENGMVCVTCSAGALFRAGEEQTIRKRVFEDNLIDAIVRLPFRTLFNSPTQILVVVFRKGRKSDDGILYLDLGTQYKRSKGRNELVLDPNVEIQNIYANFLEGKNAEIQDIAKVVRYADLKAGLEGGNRLFLLQPFQAQEQDKMTFKQTRAYWEKTIDKINDRLKKRNTQLASERKWLMDHKSDQ